MSEPARPGFGDPVRIKEAPETTRRGFAGRTGSVVGQSVPSSSGVAPVIGDCGEDFALAVLFDDTDDEEWFAPHLIEFVDHGGEQVMSVEGGPTFVRDLEGNWRQEDPVTTGSDVLNPGRSVPFNIASVTGGAQLLARVFGRPSGRRWTLTRASDWLRRRRY